MEYKFVFCWRYIEIFILTADSTEINEVHLHFVGMMESHKNFYVTDLILHPSSTTCWLCFCLQMVVHAVPFLQIFAWISPSYHAGLPSLLSFHLLLFFIVLIITHYISCLAFFLFEYSFIVFSLINVWLRASSCKYLLNGWMNEALSDFQQLSKCSWVFLLKKIIKFPSRDCSKD